MLFFDEKQQKIMNFDVFIGTFADIKKRAKKGSEQVLAQELKHQAASSEQLPEEQVAALLLSM